MKNLKRKVVRELKKHVPHAVYSVLSAYTLVPENRPPSIVFDKVGSKKRSFAVRSMDMTNMRGIDYVDVNVPQYQAMHGSEYKKKHGARLKRDWKGMF